MFSVQFSLLFDWNIFCSVNAQCILLWSNGYFSGPNFFSVIQPLAAWPTNMNREVVFVLNKVDHWQSSSTSFSVVQHGNPCEQKHSPADRRYRHITSYAVGKSLSIGKPPCSPKIVMLPRAICIGEAKFCRASSGWRGRVKCPSMFSWSPQFYSL